MPWSFPATPVEVTRIDPLAPETLSSGDAPPKASEPFAIAIRKIVVSGAPPVPKTVERSNARSACATWPSTSSRAPVAENRTIGPRATFSATVSAPSVSVSATAAFVLLTSSENEPVTETPAGRFDATTPRSSPATPAAVTSSAPAPPVIPMP